MAEQSTHQPITLKKNRSYRTYQLHARIAGAGEELSSTDEVLVRSVVHIMRWLRLKFQDVGAPEEVLTCEPAESTSVSFADLTSFDAREVAGYQLEVIADAERQLWAMRLREPDLGAPGRPGTATYKKFEALPGRMYETNIGLAIHDGCVELGVCGVISEPDASDKKGAGFRLAVVGNLVEDKDLVLTVGSSPIVKSALRCSDEQSVEQFVSWLSDEKRQEPVLLVCSGSHDNTVDADALANELFGYCQVFSVAAQDLPLLSEGGIKAEPDDLLMFFAGSEQSLEADIKLRGYPYQLIYSLIVEQAKFYSTGKMYKFGAVRHIADFQHEHYQELDAARLRKWAELDEANQKIAELEEQKETLEEQKDVAQHELEQVRQQLESAEAEARATHGDLQIINKAVDHAASTIRQNVYEQTAFSRGTSRAKILFIGGGRGLKDKDLQGILKSFGFRHPSECYEWIKYDDVKAFNFQSLIGSTKYSDVILGVSPHKCIGLGKYESPVSFLQKEAELPHVAILQRGGALDNFTKSNIRPLIEKSVALEQARGALY